MRTGSGMVGAVVAGLIIATGSLLIEYKSGWFQNSAATAPVSYGSATDHSRSQKEPSRARKETIETMPDETLGEPTSSSYRSIPEVSARPEGTSNEITHLSPISGYWVLRPEGQPDMSPVTSQRINVDGARLLVSGDGWYGEGEFDGRSGYYRWTFTEGRTGRTEIYLDGDGVLHGKVRGSGIDWDYQATREH